MFEFESGQFLISWKVMQKNQTILVTGLINKIFSVELNSCFFPMRNAKFVQIIQMCALYFWSIFLSFPFFHFLYASNAIFQLSSRLVDVHRNYKTKYPCLFKNSLKCIFIEVFFKSTTLATTSKAIYSVDVKTKISITICR